MRAIATDQAGHPSPADTATSITVDNTAPTVTLGGIATNAKVRGTVPLTASADDGAGTGVVSVAFEIFNGSWTPLSTDSSAPFTASWDTTGLNGTYQVRAIATDLVGNPSLADTASNITVDNTAPTVTLGGIATNAKVRGTVALDGVRERRVGLGCGFCAVRDLRRHVDGALDGQQRAVHRELEHDGARTGRIRCARSRPTSRAIRRSRTPPRTSRSTTPVPTVTLGGLATNAKVRATVPLTASVDDGTGSGVESVAFERFNGTWGSDLDRQQRAVHGELEHDRAERRSTRCAPIATDGAGNASPADTGHQHHGRQHDSERPRWRPRRTSRRSRRRRQITFTASTDPTVNGATTGVEHYDVYRTDPGHLTPVKVNPTPIDGLVARAVQLHRRLGDHSDTYTYTVGPSTSSAIRLTPSGGLAVFVDPAAVSSPTGVTALANPTSQLPQVSWTAPASPGFTIAHYNVYRDTGPSPVGVINVPEHDVHGLRHQRAGRTRTAWSP